MNNKNLMMTVLMIGLMSGAVGCNKSSQFETPDSTLIDGFVPTSPNGTTTTSSTGNQVDFTPVSLDEMNSYVATHPLNNPSNFKLTVALADAAAGRYAGSVSISYTDNGQNYNGVFKAGSGVNSSCSGCNDKGKYEAEYNRWFNLNGVKYFSGFYQDSFGAIILVVDSTVNQGDAQGTTVVSGSVYYRNFGQSYAPQSSERKCWYITQGPYECQDSGVMAKSALYPTTANGYRKLGTFSGLTTSAAFK